MIKMIATDMDGTLLNSKKQLTEKSIKTILAVKNMGIHFAVASGRQYKNIYNIFERNNIEKDVSFLAENGTIIFDKGRLISVSALSDEVVRLAVELARKTPDICPVLCGVQAAYIENEKLKSIVEVSNYFDDRKFLTDVLQCLEFDKITKVSLLTPKFSAESLTYPIFKRFEKDAQVLLSGPKWVDLISKGASKGTAVELIGRKYGATFDQRMAFGNYLNDVELLKACRFSFAVENAHEALKKVSYKTCPSNDQDGVAQTLIEWFDLKI